MNSDYQILSGELSSLLDSIFDNLRKFENKKNSYTELNGLTVKEIKTLVAVGIGSMKSMTEIARYLGVSLSTPTTAVDRLIKKGYVERLRDINDDRRQVFVRCSDKGARTVSLIIEMKRNFFNSILEGLDSNEQRCFIDSLIKLNRRFKEVLAEI